jgi:16S rRNA (cytosine1402-N4)-methyltransferase
MLAEVVRHLRPAPGLRMLDCTLGLGGHSAALLEAGAAVVGVDRDPRARALAGERLARFGGRFAARGGTFAEAAADLAAEGERFDGVLADIGVSSLQLDDQQRGFGIHADAAPDMRMGEGCPETALDLIDRLSEDALADIIFQYGEERMSRRIARAIKLGRRAGTLATAVDLAAAVRGAVPGHHPRHPAMRTFQALRIAVNDELGEIARLLARLPEVLAPGGTAVVISFHSLEDRLVKESFRSLRQAGIYADAARKVETAGDAEVAANPRAQSAKLRWATRASSQPAAPRHPRGTP